MKKCKLCGTAMFISAWDGWDWLCPECNYQTEATDKEIEEDEKETIKQLKKLEKDQKKGNNK